jgi:hypothetical protein
MADLSFNIEEIYQGAAVKPQRYAKKTYNDDQKENGAYVDALCSLGSMDRRRKCASSEVGVVGSMGQPMGVTVGALCGGVFLAKLFGTSIQVVDQSSGAETASGALPRQG